MFKWLRQAGAAIIFVFGLSGEIPASTADHALNLYHVEAAVHQTERGGPKFAENVEVAKFAIYIDSSGIIADHINFALCEDAIERNHNIFKISWVYRNPFWVELPNVKLWCGWMRFNDYIRPMSYIARRGLTKVFVVKDRPWHGANIKLGNAFNGNSNVSPRLTPSSSDDYAQRGSLEQRANGNNGTQKYRNIVVQRLILGFLFVFGGFFLAINELLNFTVGVLLIAIGFGLLWLVTIPSTFGWPL